MKKSIVLGLMILFSIQMNSQQNVIGLHLAPLGIGEIRLGYERAVTSNVTFGVNAGYVIANEIPNFLYEPEDIVPNGFTVESSNEIRGYSVIPEIKRYFGRKDAPRGFYIGAFGRLAHYEFDMMDIITYEFSTDEFDDLEPEVQELVDENNELEMNVELKSEIDQMGIGIQFGYQVFLGQRLTLDIYFLGVSLDRTDLDATLVSPTIPVDYNKWVSEVEMAVDDLSKYPFLEDVDVAAIDNGISLSAKGYMPWYRGGFKLGFAF